jgi:hypothetical protein
MSLVFLGLLSGEQIYSPGNATMGPELSLLQLGARRVSPLLLMT